ncbi:MAG: hypothetical protein HKL96_13795 [Phycisphaerales bacterium]|nr:hypothetical protein [Phycisphaerales bacterium]
MLAIAIDIKKAFHRPPNRQANWWLPALLAACLSVTGSARLGLAAALKLSILAANHPSGIYHTGEKADFELVAANPTDQPQLFSGHLQWMFRPASRQSDLSHAPWRNLAVTPVVPASIPAHGAVALRLPEDFRGIGCYRLQWRHQWLAANDRKDLLCIMPPTLPPQGRTAWLAQPPQPFFAPHAETFIADYIRQTGIERFVLPLQSNSITRAEALLARQIAAAHGEPILQAMLPAIPPRHWVLSLFELAKRLRWAIKTSHAPAMVLRAAPGLAVTPRQLRALLAWLRRWQPHLQIYLSPQLWPTGKLPAARSMATPTGIAVSDSPINLVAAQLWVKRGIPLWLLPTAAKQTAIAPGVALALGAKVVAYDSSDFGTAAHWLGAAQLFRTVHDALPGVRAVFAQPDQTAVAVIAGLGAGGLCDQKWLAWRLWPAGNCSPLPAAQQNRTITLSTRWPIGSLRVYDAAGVMRSVNSLGQTIPTSIPGWKELPLNPQVAYILSGNSPQSLVAALQTSAIAGLPPVAVAPLSQSPQLPGVANQAISAHAADVGSVPVLLANARIGRIKGLARCVWAPVGQLHADGKHIHYDLSGSHFGPWVHFGPVDTGRSVPLVLPVPAKSAAPGTEPVSSLTSSTQSSDPKATATQPLTRPITYDRFIEVRLTGKKSRTWCFLLRSAVTSR